MELKQLAVKINDIFNDRSYRTTTKEYVDPGVTGKDIPTGQELTGVEAFVQYNDGFVNAMPDIKGTLVEQKVEGNKVTSRIHGQGTFTGKLVTPQGILPGNGKKLDLEYSAEFEFNDAGKLVHYVFNYDMSEFMRQLGVG